MSDGAVNFAELVAGLRVPVVAAPMFLVSGSELVLAACGSGVMGTFPAPNARTTDDLAEWLDRVSTGLISAGLSPRRTPWAINVVCHRTYNRLDRELDLIEYHRPPVVITALGSPRRVLDRVHGWGGFVFADVNNLEHAERCIEAGVDGLIVVCAGAGGHTGSYTPFALVPEVRRRWKGPLIAGGGVGSGQGVLAMRVLGADLAYVGTRFLASAQSLAADPHRRMAVAAGVADVIVSDRVTGVPANWLKESLAGFTADSGTRSIDFSGDIATDVKAWRDVWSAGQGVGMVPAIEPVGDIVDQLCREYRLAMATVVQS